MQRKQTKTNTSNCYAAETINGELLKQMYVKNNVCDKKTNSCLKCLSLCLSFNQLKNADNFNKSD